MLSKGKLAAEQLVVMLTGSWHMSGLWPRTL